MIVFSYHCPYEATDVYTLHEFHDGVELNGRAFLKKWLEACTNLRNVRYTAKLIGAMLIYCCIKTQHLL